MVYVSARRWWTNRVYSAIFCSVSFKNAIASREKLRKTHKKKYVR